MNPPPPADSSLPPRHRPSIESLAKNSSEDDLWDLADLLPPDDAQEAAPVTVLPRKGPSIPAPAFGEDATPDAVGGKSNPPILQVPIAPRHHLSQSSNVERLGRARFAQAAQAQDGELDPPVPANKVSVLEDTFDNLEDWDHAEQGPDVAAAPAPPVTAIAPAIDEPAPPPAVPAPAVAVAAAASAADDEFSPVVAPSAKPISLRPKLALSKTESLSLLALAVTLLVGGCWVYENSLSPLLRQAGQTQDVKFPVQGEHVTVTRVVTYWREPFKADNQVEAVRRGVVLIPVVEITLHGGPAAIRALVHNDNNLAVGDPITRPIDGETTLILPATDGFEDLSMHAAYRAGQTRPWTVRLFEAATTTAQGKDFKKLLEVPISNEKR